MNTEYLKNGTGVFTSDKIRFTQDSAILADFASVTPHARLLELGGGCGIIPLWLYDRGCLGECVSVEISKSACELFELSVCVNNIDSITVSNSDLRTFRDERKFDIAVSNPPFFSTSCGGQSPEDWRRGARSEECCNFYELCAAARRNLKEKGRFVFCHRPKRLAELCGTLRDFELEPKRIRFARSVGKSEPWLVLVEARYRGGVGLSVMPELLSESEEMDAICAKGVSNDGC
ncbi:MAG: methyltransferase [Oscillospiraceae bacterium]